jgi:hypothetical protein
MPTTTAELRNVSTVVSAAPATNVTIQPLGHRVSVEIVYDEGQWVAVEGFTGMFGEGDTKSEAFTDLMRGLVDLRQELALHREALTPQLRDQLAAIEAVIGSAG